MITRLILLLCISMSCLQAQTLPEKPMAVILPSYNNATSTKATLDSVMAQKYTNFRVVCIDDASKDGTGDVIANYIKENNLEQKITLIRNKERCRKLKNIYNAIHACRDDEIVVQIDGDDRWDHDHVLADLNAAYTHEDVWLTYSRHRNVPPEEVKRWKHKEVEYKELPQNVIDKRSYRKYQWTYGQQRTWYAWLFKCIKLDDLFAKNVVGFEENFYPASNDVAIMMPMLEMAQTHIKFMPDVAYIRNLYSPIVGFKVDSGLQQKSATEIRGKQQYQQLAKPVVGRMAAFDHARADVIIFAKNKHDNTTKALLESLTHYVHGLASIHILSDAQEAVDINNNHVLLINEVCIFTDHIDINSCIKLLEQTFASRFCLDHNLQLHANKPYQHLINDVYASRVMPQGRKNPLVTLYRKKDLFKYHHQKTIGSFSFNNTRSNHLDLFFKDAKIKKIPTF